MVTLSFTIFSGQKNYNRAHMLFQVLCGLEPIFYTTHPNEEPNIDYLSPSQCKKEFSSPDLNICIHNIAIHQLHFLQTLSICSYISPHDISKILSIILLLLPSLIIIHRTILDCISHMLRKHRITDYFSQILT